jgi:hypothetical protein
LLIVEDASENERQEEKHLMYVQQIGDAIAEADEHLKSRADEAPSVVNGGRAKRVTEEEILAAKQLIEQTRTQAEQARKRAEELQIQQQQAEEALQDLQQDDANPDNFSSVSNRGGSFTKLAADWKRKQAQQNTAPDDWIDGYANGTLKPIYTAGSRSSVKADLEPFSGRSLDWFAWIDLFRALVHDTAKSPGEKLALLHRYVRGDCLDVIHGLGGGEGAYIEALIRLKESCGRRDVMRAAHIQAIEGLELKTIPPSLKGTLKRYGLICLTSLVLGRRLLRD